jgi:hypothetical protein
MNRYMHTFADETGEFNGRYIPKVQPAGDVDLPTIISTMIDLLTISEIHFRYIYMSRRT